MTSSIDCNIEKIIDNTERYEKGIFCFGFCLASLFLSIPSLTSRLVQATLADVPYPFDRFRIGVVELVLEHLEVSHFEARRRKGHLEAHRDRRTIPLLLVVGQQFDLRTQLRLLHTAHALHLPHDGIVR